MKKRPYVIAHRGYCSMFPQNTLASFQSALYKCDLIQFDIMLTKDHQVIVFHDRYLSRLTNISSFQKHKNKKRVAAYDVYPGGPKEHDDWWVIDFTLQELRQLTVRQPFEQRPQLKGLQFKISTLQEAIEQILEIKKNRLKENICGFLAQIKCQYEQKDDKQDRILADKIVLILQKYELDTEQKCKDKRFPFIIQAFNHTILDILSKSSLNVPIIHLFADEQNLNKTILTQNLVKNMKGIGISQKHATSNIRELTEQMNLKMFYWTLRDDHLKKIPFDCKTYREAYRHLLNIGIDGFITQFPQLCQQYISEYTNE